MQSELKIDMDWLPPIEFLDMWTNWAIQIIYKEVGKLPISYITLSPSGRGYHVRFKLFADIDDFLALKLQFVLGDDRVRCKLNYERWKAGVKDWNKLFCRKTKLGIEHCRIKIEDKQESHHLFEDKPFSSQEDYQSGSW